MFWNKMRVVASAKATVYWTRTRRRMGMRFIKKQPNDNAKVNRTQVIHFQISTSAESNFAA